MDDVSIPREKLRVLVDTIACSMDFGSGFLDIEDIEALWVAADILGISKFDVTPSEMKHLIPHKYERWPTSSPAGGSLLIGLYWSDRCKHCSKLEDFETHV